MRQDRMGWLRVAFIVASIILAFIILYAIINCEVTYKYEIEGRAGEKVDISWVETYLNEIVKVWKFFLCYTVVNIIFLLMSAISHYRKNRN